MEQREQIGNAETLENTGFLERQAGFDSPISCVKTLKPTYGCGFQRFFFYKYNESYVFTRKESYNIRIVL